jgi:hypothetical protein
MYFNLIEAADLLGVQPDTMRKILSLKKDNIEGIKKEGRAWIVSHQGIMLLISEHGYKAEKKRLEAQGRYLKEMLLHNIIDISKVFGQESKAPDGFISIPRAIVDTDEFNDELNAYSVKVFIQIIGQQSPDVNGYYDCDASYFADKGWTNSRIVENGLRQLAYAGVIIIEDYTVENGSTIKKCRVNW